MAEVLGEGAASAASAEDGRGTREQAKAAAWQILRGGERPTTINVRAALGGRGSQQTLVAALNEFWRDLGDLLDPGELPLDVVRGCYALWQAAVEEAERRWEGERRRLAAAAQVADEALAQSELERHGLALALEEREAANRACEGALAERCAELEAERTRSAEEAEARVQAQREVASLGEVLAEERALREQESAQALREIDALRQTIKAGDKERTRLTGELELARRELAEEKIAGVTLRQELGSVQARLAEEQAAAQHQGALLRASGEELGRLRSERATVAVDLEREEARARALEERLRVGEEARLALAVKIAALEEGLRGAHAALDAAQADRRDLEQAVAVAIERALGRKRRERAKPRGSGAD